MGFATRARAHRVFAQAHRAALCGYALLFGHKIDDKMLRIGSELGGVASFQPRTWRANSMTAIWKAETYSEIRHIVFARVFCSQDHTLYAAVAEAAGH